MIRNSLNKIFKEQSKAKDPIYTAQYILFLMGCFLIGFNFFKSNEKSAYTNFLLISSIIAAAIFFVFAFIARRKPIQIIFSSIALYSIVLIVNGILYLGSILTHVILKLLVYFVLVRTFYELKNSKEENLE